MFHKTKKKEETSKKILHYVISNVTERMTKGENFQYQPSHNDLKGILIAIGILILFGRCWYHALFQIDLFQSSWFDIFLTFHLLEFLYTGLFITCHDAMHGAISPRVIHC